MAFLLLHNYTDFIQKILPFFQLKFYINLLSFLGPPLKLFQDSKQNAKVALHLFIFFNNWINASTYS